MIFENELDRGQGFKNHYESTKYAAEVLVERSKGEIETRILRPAIVIGDSETGETAKFDGPYASFGAIMMGLMVVIPGPGRAAVNLVPVDFIIDCLATIPKQPNTAGKTFQLADPNPLTARELVELAADRLGAPRPRLRLPGFLFKPVFNVKKLSELSGITPESFAYFNHSQIFDTTNTRSALAGTGVSCPPIRSYINQILRYYRDRAELPWRLDAPA
jgi:thioester reductase-like protein